MEDRITTLHPDPLKRGVNISRAKYEQVRQVLLNIVEDNEGITFEELMRCAEAKLQGKFDGSIGWYVTTVKLDLEARGELTRISKASPQRLRV